MVDRELSPTDLKNRGRRQWWMESIRPFLGHIHTKTITNTVEWCKSISHHPIEVTQYTMESVTETETVETPSLWCMRDYLVPRRSFGSAVKLRAVQSSPKSLCYDVLVIESDRVQKGLRHFCEGGSPRVCSAINIRDIVEVRCGVDSHVFRLLLDAESNTIDYRKANLVCVGVFTSTCSLFFEFADPLARDTFATNLRILTRLIRLDFDKQQQLFLRLDDAARSLHTMT